MVPGTPGYRPHGSAMSKSIVKNQSRRKTTAQVEELMTHFGIYPRCLAHEQQHKQQVEFFFLPGPRLQTLAENRRSQVTPLALAHPLPVSQGLTPEAPGGQSSGLEALHTGNQGSGPDVKDKTNCSLYQSISHRWRLWG